MVEPTNGCENVGEIRRFPGAGFRVGKASDEMVGWMFQIWKSDKSFSHWVGFGRLREGRGASGPGRTPPVFGCMGVPGEMRVRESVMKNPLDQVEGKIWAGLTTCFWAVLKYQAEKRTGGVLPC